jgi:ATP-dependent Clp protease protease subunit
MRPNRILQLLNDNRRAPRRFNVEASADAGEATIYLYDMIVSDDFWGGVSAQAFVEALASITASTIHLRVNSPGGDVFAARAMETALRGTQARVIAHVDGYAASAASSLIMAADEIEIADGGFVMIHKAWSIAIGNADEMLAMGALLNKIDGSLVKTYADRTRQEPDQIETWMAAETWFDADEAIANGFADRKATFDGAQDSAWNLSAYANAPAGRTPTSPAAPPANSAPPQDPPAQPDREAMHREVLRISIPV